MMTPEPSDCSISRVVVYTPTTAGMTRLTSCANESGASPPRAGARCSSSCFQRQPPPAAPSIARASSPGTTLFLGRLDILEAQVVKDVLEQTILIVRKVATGLSLKHPEHIDGLLGERQVDL